MNITEDDALECWGVLESAIQQIHEQNASRLSFEELYRRAYTLVLHRYGAMLYTGFETSLRNHLTNVRAKFTDKSGMAFVSEVLAQWSTYHKSTQMIRDILMVRSASRSRDSARAATYIDIKSPLSMSVFISGGRSRSVCGSGQCWTTIFITGEINEPTPTSYLWHRILRSAQIFFLDVLIH